MWRIHDWLTNVFYFKQTKDFLNKQLVSLENFSSYHHHIIIIKNGEDSSLICGFTALWRLGFFILSSSHYHHPDLWLHRPLMAQKMVRIFARFVASPPAEGSKNGEDSSLICGFTARWRLGFFILSSSHLVQYSAQTGKILLKFADTLTLGRAKYKNVQLCWMVMDVIIKY